MPNSPQRPRRADRTGRRAAPRAPALRAFGILVVATLATAATAAPQVVATTGMIGDVATGVAGDCLDVVTLMGPGVDPHLYRATARDVQSLQRADMVLFHGLGLEGQLAQTLGRLGARIPTLAVGETVVPPERLLHDADGLVDPHIWMDPSIWRELPPLLAGRFAEVAPACADDLGERAAALVTLIDDLDAWTRATLSTVPPDVRVLVTAHDAFAYVADTYDLEVVAIQGISTEAEPSVRDIRETADVVVERRVPAVFFETSISPRTVEAVLAAARDRGAEVRVGGELYADALGPAGTSAGTYVGMMVHTVATIATGLGGSVAAWPPALAAWADAWDDLPEPSGAAAR